VKENDRVLPVALEINLKCIDWQTVIDAIQCDDARVQAASNCCF
jgi:hypothetical protein